MRSWFLVLVLFVNFSVAQTIPQKLERAVENLSKSAGGLSANISLYVSDEAGNLIYQHNGNLGLTSASTQKIFTAAAALETLGTDYRYSTTASYTGKINNGVLSGDLILKSNGDPTLGSWRYDGYKPEDFRKKLIAALTEIGIKTIEGDIVIDDSYFDIQTVPGGWPWNDLGNYYGAGVWGVNWRENQFDLTVTKGIISKTNVPLPEVAWMNDVQARGTSDQSLIFTAPYSSVAYINGSLPSKSTTVSGAMPNPPITLAAEVKSWIEAQNIELRGTTSSYSLQRIATGKTPVSPRATIFLTYESPALSQIVFWFLRKSVNLYGENLIKTMAAEKKKEPTFDAGISYLKSFWQSKGIAGNMINFADGSGLSPQNYVSAKAEVQALLYSKKQSWFPEFAEGFPTQANGMKMKSGTMKNTKSFAGYHTAKNGKKYVFSIIINNYQGNNSSQALYEVLSFLK